MVYEWKRSMPVKAQDAGEYLSRLENKHGKLTQGLIVEESTPKEAPLHGLFEWDNSKAADEYRKSQAGYILRNLVVVKVAQAEIKGPSEVRAFVNVTDKNNLGYVSIDTALRDCDMRDHLLQSAVSDLKAFRKKYIQLKELTNLIAVIDKAIA